MTADTKNYVHLQTHDELLCRTCGFCGTCECSCGAPVEDWQDRPIRRATSIADLRGGAIYNMAGARLACIHEHACDSANGTPIYTTYLAREHSRHVLFSKPALAEFFSAGGFVLEMAPPPEQREGEQ